MTDSSEKRITQFIEHIGRRQREREEKGKGKSKSLYVGQSAFGKPKTRFALCEHFILSSLGISNLKSIFTHDLEALCLRPMLSIVILVRV